MDNLKASMELLDRAVAAVRHLRDINGHLVAVPADMEVKKEFGIPGGYDHIKYRGAEIVTYETDEADELTEYTGPFHVFVSALPDSLCVLA